MLDLSIIILNYRTPELTIQCLASLAPEISGSANTSVFVVDNASGDGSVEKIRAAIDKNSWARWASILTTDRNKGYAAGNNYGINAQQASLYVLLNSDTVIHLGAMRELLVAAKTYPDAGIIAPRLEWPDGSRQTSCFRYHSLISEMIRGANTGPITKIFKDYEVPIHELKGGINPEWVSFACVLIRGDVIKSIGLMDENYFMYFEDVDYCRRACRAGWKIMYWNKSVIIHLKGQSSTFESLVSDRRRLPKYYYQARSRYFAKYYGTFGLWIANIMWVIGRSISIIREILSNKKSNVYQNEFSDLWTDCIYPLAPRSDGYKN